MQGCKKPENKTVVEETPPPLPLPPLTSDVATQDNPQATSVVSATASNVVPPVPEPLASTPTPTPTPFTPEPGREYVVAKGDSFYTIAKKAGVSMKAVEQANPGVSSTRLKIGQKLQLPAPGSAATAPAPSAASSVASTDSGDSTIYVVKAGDMLEKIARRNGTTAKAIMNENNLKTTLIKVGQKLKIPASKISGREPVASSNYVTPLPSGAPTP